MRSMVERERRQARPASSKPTGSIRSDARPPCSVGNGLWRPRSLSTALRAVPLPLRWRSHGRSDGLDRLVQMLEDVRRREAERANAAGGQPSVTRLISSRRVAESMRFAVDLNRDGRPIAIEVEHIRPDRMLPTNVPAEGAPAQRAPQHKLRQRHAAAEYLRLGSRRRRRVHYFASSSSMAPIRVGSCGSRRGEKRRETWPSLAIRNFSKFHRIEPSGAARSPTPSAAGIALVRVS